VTWRERASVAAAVVWGGALVAALVVYNLYCLSWNQTNHTGLPTEWVVAGAFGSASLSTLLALVCSSKPLRRSLAVASLLGALLGVNSLVYLRAGIMMSYEAWLERRMPDKPRWP
jgi:hypothetical protein